MEIAPTTETALMVVNRRKPGPVGLYKPEYCQEIIDFFVNAPLETTTTDLSLKQTNYVNVPGKNGNPGGPVMTTGWKRDAVRRICATMPSYERFAVSRGVTRMTLWNWRKQHPEFEDACKICDDAQKDFLQQGIWSGAVNPAAGIFVAKNVTSHMDNPLVDRVEHGVTQAPPGVEGERPLLAQRTPEELAKLKAVMEQAKALGATVVLSGESKG